MQAPHIRPRHLHVVPTTPPLMRPATEVRPTPAPRRRPSARRRQHNEAVIELTLKLVVNLVIIAIAGTAFSKLWVYHTTQQVRLSEARQELAKAEHRMDGVQKDFGRHFDPQQAQTIMQEQTHRLSPQQRQIVWVDRYSNPD